MTSITPRVRCGLPTNPREWLLEKNKSPLKGSTKVEVKSQVVNHNIRTREEARIVVEERVKSPIIQGEFEDLIDYYSTPDEQYWSTSAKIPLLVEKLSSIQDQPLNLSLGKISYPSDRSSSVSDASNVSLLSNASGKSARRKKRIFPGVLASLQPATLSSSLSSNLPEELDQEKIIKSQPHSPKRTTTSREHDRDRWNDKPNRRLSKGTAISEPLPNTALREATEPGRTEMQEGEEGSYWDELEVLEAYSSMDVTDERGSSSSDSHQDVLSMNLNLLSLPNSHHKHHQHHHQQQHRHHHQQQQQEGEETNYKQFLLPTYPIENPPLSANSDLSRYSVESG